MAGPLITGALIGAALVPLAVFAWLAAHRIGYPYELDWMEGGSVGLAARVLAGHSLYVAPSLTYVGWTYPPLYYWLSAGVAELTGIGFAPLRLVSALASIVSMATLARVVVRQSRDRAAALGAAGLFAATFPLSGYWVDVGRVDALFGALTLVALAWGARARSVRDGAVLGTLCFLAAFTKQSALLALLPALALLVRARPRAGWTAVAALVVTLGAAGLVLELTSHGWFRYYALDELSGQPWVDTLWVGFWRDDLLAHLWPAAMLGVAALALGRRAEAGAGDARSETDRAPAGYWPLAAAGLLAAAWVSRLHTGGYLNVLIPAHAAVALTAGLACARLRRHGPATSALAAGLVILQVAVLWHDPAAQLPTAAERRAGAALTALVHRLPAPILVLRHPWYAQAAGRGTFAQAEAISDVLRSAAPRGRRALRADLGRALLRDGVRSVVLDGSFDAHVLGAGFARRFRLVAAIPAGDRPYPLTDTHTAPAFVYTRR